MRICFSDLFSVSFLLSGKHSLQYFYTATSGLPNFPKFVTVGLVDEQPFTYYDSNIRRETPRQEWMAKSVEEDYWERNTQISIGAEQNFMSLLEQNSTVLNDVSNMLKGARNKQANMLRPNNYIATP
uniref:MHC class I-like antigen recognition-like domain-containing protein n=1 Tax=Sinocyclocheilus rhinocerous TaxID=307959 RepID=A0A673KS96_9TELE